MTRESLKNFGNCHFSYCAYFEQISDDVCLYMNQNFGFITFPDTFTTGSSIMPHKKKSRYFELIRGKCNILQGVPTELILLTNNLPSGYINEKW